MYMNHKKCVLESLLKDILDLIALTNINNIYLCHPHLFYIGQYMGFPYVVGWGSRLQLGV